MYKCTCVLAKVVKPTKVDYFLVKNVEKNFTQSVLEKYYDKCCWRRLVEIRQFKIHIENKIKYFKN